MTDLAVPHRTNYAERLTMPTRCLSVRSVPADVAVTVAVLLIASGRLGALGRGAEELECGRLTDGRAGLLGDPEG